MPNVQRITPFLWFDDQAEEAAELYTSIFQDSRIVKVSRYGEAGQEIHGKEPGTAMVVQFELAGQTFHALNGGPAFRFTEAVSFVITCEDQAEVDHFWDRLSAGGDEAAQRCGWLKDRYGLSWQVVPAALPALVGDAGSERSQRAMNAMLQMKKLDIAALQRAYDG